MKGIARRRSERAYRIKKARRILELRGWMREGSVPHTPQLWADNLKKCSCSMCGNPRRHMKGEERFTVAERRQRYGEVADQKIEDSGNCICEARPGFWSMEEFFQYDFFPSTTSWFWLPRSILTPTGDNTYCYSLRSGDRIPFDTENLTRLWCICDELGYFPLKEMAA
jgi:hypothetical protein